MDSQELSAESQPTTFKSFTLTVKKRTVVEITALPEDRPDSDEETSEPDVRKARITHFEDGVMVTDEVKSKPKGPLVIDRVISKDWRLKQLQEKEVNGTLTDEERARLALMLEASGDDVSHKLFLANLNHSFQVGEGKTQTITVDNVDEVPDDPDYSQVRIEDFGMAVLRGYGFKEAEGIGKTNKKAVDVKRQERRVKNLGLGATVPDAEDLKNLKVGSKVYITAGSSAERYGIVESIDGDNVTCYVKLAISKKMVKVSQLTVKIVSSKDYEKNSKVISKFFPAFIHTNDIKHEFTDHKSYEDAREKQQVLLESEQRKENPKKSSQRQETRRARSRSPSPASKPWAVENLRVRCVNKEYKRGDYYKTKMVVIEASDRNNCLLRDEDGRKHELKEKWIETVIPKGKGGKVMVLAGQYRGGVGQIIDRDDKKYKVWVALHESDDVVKVDFDDACEYVGYIPDLDLHE